MDRSGHLPIHAAVAYYRVSTAGQGRSGLGLDAQREAVHRFVAAEEWS
jgi:DNA invertase Pin-like site-specific DNA recombinase